VRAAVPRCGPDRSCLAETVFAHPVLAGGGTGAAIASLYAYGLIWYQGGNIFLLALLQPVVFAAQALGMAFALGFVWVFGSMRSKLTQ